MQKEDVHELLREHGYSEDASLEWQAFNELLCAKVTERTPQVRATDLQQHTYADWVLCLLCTLLDNMQKDVALSSSCFRHLQCYTQCMPSNANSSIHIILLPLSLMPAG
jgi:hypothetical protein